MNKQIIYFDMDGVLADLGAAIAVHPDKDLPEYENDKDHLPNVFKDPPPIQGAVEAVNKLYSSDKYELFVASTSPWHNPNALTHKRLWLEKYFGDIFYKKAIFTHRKDLLIGDFLIDDRTKNGAAEFKGKHIHFGVKGECKDWNEVLEYLGKN
jgi:5'(3')-deoxyribonucleotidase